MDMSDYSALSLLLGAYLHQDFLHEFPSAMDAVQAFATQEPGDLVQTAADDITKLLQDEQFQKSPDAALQALHCCYLPRSEGRSPAEWLIQVQRMLRRE